MSTADKLRRRLTSESHKSVYLDKEEELSLVLYS